MAFLINYYLKERKYVIIDESLNCAKNRHSYVIKANNVFTNYSPECMRYNASLGDYCCNENIKLALNYISKKDIYSDIEMFFSFENARDIINSWVNNTGLSKWVNDYEFIGTYSFNYYIKEFKNN